MTKFIEVTELLFTDDTTSFKKVLNTQNIVCFYSYSTETNKQIQTTIYCTYADEAENIYIKESYEELKQKLLEA